MKIINQLFLLLALLPLSLTAQRNNFEISKSVGIYNNVLKELNMNYVDEIDPAELNKAAINAMLDGLDPYTVFIPESDIEDYKLMTTGEYGGIGALIQYTNGYVQISEPYEGFPAQKAGLVPGDIFLEVNGVDVKGKNTAEISELLKGQPGTNVELKLKRYNEKNPVTKTLVREKVKLANIPYSNVFDNGIGYIILNQFTKNAASELKETFLKMKQEHDLKGLVIDLRGNGGGLLNEAVDIVNIFVPKNKLVVYTKGKSAQQNYNHFTKNEPCDTEIPLVVLVNGASASASEIVAGSIQDFDRGVIVGQRTFGKGLVQNILPMNYNTQIKVTVAKYYIPSNRCIQEIDYSKKKGVVGDTIAQQDTLGPDFKTANGRIVHEGHGIMPDIKIEPDEISTLTVNLYAQNMFFDFANKYYWEHKSIPSPETFRIEDDVYQDFVKFVGEKNFTYTTESERKISDLRKTAEREGYLEVLKPQLEVLETEMKDSKSNDFATYRNEIEEFLQNEIVSRYYYQKGRIITGLGNDTELEKAFEIILDKNEYDKILKGEK